MSSSPAPTAAATLPAPRRRLNPLHVGFGVALLTAGILVIGAPFPWPFGKGADQPVAIGPGDTFNPAQVTIREGDTIVWTFDGKKHTVTSTGGPGQAFDSGSQSTGTFSHKFTQAGTYPYICALHSKMKASIVVLPAEAPAPTPAIPAQTPAAVTKVAPSTSSPAAPAASPAPSAEVAPTALVDAAPPRIAAAKLTVPRRCARTRCAAVLSLRLSEPAYLSVSARGRRLFGATVSSGHAKVRIALTRVGARGAKLRIVAVDAAGNRSRAVRLTARAAS